MKVLVSEIKIGSRFRAANKDAVEARAESFKRLGQLQPIILSDAKELVAGLHRLLAAKFLGWTEIDAIYRDHMTDVERREIELEENISRLDMDWFDRANAIAEIDKLKRSQNPNWSQDMTAAVAGAYQKDVSKSLKIVRLAQLFPELKDAKSLNQAESWALTKVASVIRLKEVKDNPVEFKAIEEKIWHDDSVEAIKRVPSRSFRAIVTDPPFGISYDKRKAGTEQSITAYQDDEESYRRLLTMAPDIYRVLKDDGWLIWFCGPSWYERVKTVFREAGFTVDEIPILWIRTAGRCYTARPDRYFGRGYDMAIHCLKGDPEMIIRGRHNVFDFPPVESSDRELLVERPVELYAEIIRHLTVPGETVADFFVGSGSVLAAAASLRRDYFGVEIDQERRAVAVKKVRAYTP